MMAEIDDVMITLCEGCAVPFALGEGWQGHCPSCCALIAEHLDGKHHLRVDIECRYCLEADGPALRDTA